MIAAVVGSVLTAVNLSGSIPRGEVDAHVLLKIAANFCVPFIVSNLGAMASLAHESKPDEETRARAR